MVQIDLCTLEQGVIAAGVAEAPEVTKQQKIKGGKFTRFLLQCGQSNGAKKPKALAKWECENSTGKWAFKPLSGAKICS